MINRNQAIEKYGENLLPELLTEENNGIIEWYYDDGNTANLVDTGYYISREDGSPLFVSQYN